MARWWDRLGGRPVDHTASPRAICRDTRHSYWYSKSKYRGRNHVIQQKCAKTECVRVNLPPHSTPLTIELYLGRPPDARQKAAIFPFFSRCHCPVPAAGSPVRVLCDTLISLKMWLPRGASLRGGAKGPRIPLPARYYNPHFRHKRQCASLHWFARRPRSGDTRPPERAHGNTVSDASERAGRQARRQSLRRPGRCRLDHPQMCTGYAHNPEPLRSRSARHDNTTDGGRIILTSIGPHTCEPLMPEPPARVQTEDASNGFLACTKGPRRSPAPSAPPGFMIQG